MVADTFALILFAWVSLSLLSNSAPMSVAQSLGANFGFLIIGSATFLRGDFTLRAKTKLDRLCGSFYLLFGTFCISVGIYGIYKIFGNI
ncbi:MAG TPA: hypothetical protein VHT02_04790 [Methylocella sp.]|nr:hypothetical protein [Methylocella sp.]